MTVRVAILGAANRVDSAVVADLETEVRAAVSAALDAAGIGLAEIDSVVTVASDTLDGVMVPIRAEIAGSFGKSCMNVPSSAGHAISAAIVLIESGQASRVLVAGWGAASKLGRHDVRAIQADPFHDRRAGATPQAVADLQALELRAEFDGLPEGALTFTDGAVALVLGGSESGGHTRIAETGCASRGYYPEDDGVDPALWVSEAMAKWRRPVSGAPAQVAVCGPSRTSEARAVSALKATGAGDIPSGSTAWFGPATALHQLALLDARLTGPSTDEAVLLDLAGPMGQHVTCLHLVGGGAA